MVYIPNSIFHTVHIHNSIHHSELSISYNVVPIRTESTEILHKRLVCTYVATSGAVHFTGTIPPDVM